MKVPEIQINVHEHPRPQRVFSEYFINFSIACLVGFIFALLWLFIGESWGIRGDAGHYIKLYNNELAVSPFGYRILTPWLAQLFPSSWSYWTAFKIVSITSLTLSTGFVYLLMDKKEHSTFQNVSIILFWVTSFVFIYYTTTVIRPDSLMFLLLIALFVCSNFHTPYWLLFLLISFGLFAHETILIFLPAILLDKLFRGKLTNGAAYEFWQLAFVSAGAIIVFIVSRKVINVLPHVAPNYLSSPLDMVKYSLSYAGGVLKYALRIYASFGPAVILCFFYIVFFSKKEDGISFFILFILTVIATFLATDTLRIMGIVCIPVFFYATQYIYRVMTLGAFVPWILILLQALYSYIVYGHLRTFEKSVTMNIVAASISIVVFMICIGSTYKMKPEKISRFYVS